MSRSTYTVCLWLHGAAFPPLSSPLLGHRPYWTFACMTLSYDTCSHCISKEGPSQGWGSSEFPHSFLGKEHPAAPYKSGIHPRFKPPAVPLSLQSALENRFFFQMCSLPDNSQHSSSEPVVMQSVISLSKGKYQDDRRGGRGCGSLEQWLLSWVHEQRQVSQQGTEKTGILDRRTLRKQKENNNQKGLKLVRPGPCVCSLGDLTRSHNF